MMQYSYEASVGEYEATVSVVWNGDHYVGSLPVTLYKCDILGSHRDHADCSLCVTRAKKYRCAWCGNVCAYSESCPLSAASECPRPRIDVVRCSERIFIFPCLSLSFSPCNTGAGGVSISRRLRRCFLDELRRVLIFLCGRREDGDPLGSGFRTDPLDPKAATLMPCHALSLSLFLFFLAHLYL